MCHSFLNLSIEEKDSSLYVPEERTSSSTASSDETVEEETQTSRRAHLNRFLESCDVESRVGPYKKAWEKTSSRTRRNHVGKARDAIVAMLNVMTPGDGALLWETLHSSALVEEAFGIEKPSPAEEKYLLVLAETYKNASGWDTRRQILSVMADIVPLKRLQQYLPNVTEYRVKIARSHRLMYGRGVPQPPAKRARMKVDNSQLDHFLTFITSGHIIQDLPFGQKYLRLSSGDVLETPNVIRSLIPERIVRQYQQYCKETEFVPFGRTTMLNILSTCSATVRKSLQGLDYIAANGSKAFDDLCAAVTRLQECGAISRESKDEWQSSLKSGKHYLKSDYKVKYSRNPSLSLA